MLTSFEMIDSSLTSEDSQRVPAALCSHNTRLREQAPITTLVVWMQQVNEGHSNSQQPGIPNYSSGGVFSFLFTLPLHFWCTLNWRIFYAHSILYWSTAITGRVSISGTNSSLSFFFFLEWKAIRYAPHMLFILKLFLLSVHQDYI